MTDYIETCPRCKANLVDEPIPEGSRENFGGSSHFSRLIAVCSLDLDRCTHYLCPDCGIGIALDEAVRRAP